MASLAVVLRCSEVFCGQQVLSFPIRLRHDLCIDSSNFYLAESWIRLSEQFFRFDKSSLCWGLGRELVDTALPAIRRPGRRAKLGRRTVEQTRSVDIRDLRKAGYVGEVEGNWLDATRRRLETLALRETETFLRMPGPPFRRQLLDAHARKNGMLGTGWRASHMGVPRCVTTACNT
jgi:hypothetical protein